VELVGRDGVARPAESAVVWINLPGYRAPGRSAQMASRDKRFTPHVIAVRRGASITFPNNDRIYHNVFSRTQGNEFDLGLYRKGASRETVFQRPGLVHVYCNIHPEMAGYVVVLDQAAFVLTGADGVYRLDGIPGGRRTVRVWAEQGGEVQQVAELAPGLRQRLDFRLDASRYRRVPHKNKYGKDYPPVTKDVDRY
jgi:plastocyanin